jgi:hypothetical protein
LFKNLLQLIKVKLAFHITLNIVITTNCKRSNQPLNTQISFYFWDNCCIFFWKPTRDVRDNWNLQQTQIETRGWTYIGWTKFKNSNSVLCTIAYHMSSHFPLMVNNISNHWLQWNLKENMIYEFFILTNKHCNEHYLLSKWWHLVHDNFHTFWHGGIARLNMDNTLVTF